MEFNVTISRVLYPPSTADAASWYILATNCGKCTGKMLWRPREHDQLILSGEWSAYHGEKQINFSQARLNIPVNPRDQLAYVCHRTTGIGPAAESLIWEQAGENWQDIKDGEVQRISGKIYANFKLQIESLIEKSEEARVVAALMGRGASMNLACKAWEQWEGQTLGVVNDDCFRLAEIEGYSFRDVDKEIRRSYGIADDDKRRIRAGVIYTLRRLTDSGDTVVDWVDLFHQTTGLLGGYADLISDCTRELFDEGTLKAFSDSWGVSLAADWAAENEIWEWVNSVKEGQTA